MIAIFCDILNLYRDIRQNFSEDLLFNEEGKLNNGDYCKCSLKTRTYGINHNIYVGEKETLESIARCNLKGNTYTLFYYVISLNPLTNIMDNEQTHINYEGEDYAFQGFSIMTHQRLEHLQPCHFSRYNIDYSLTLKEAKMPMKFNIESLVMVEKYLFKHILELYDWDHRTGALDGDLCDGNIHIMPRFGLDSPNSDPLPIDVVLEYFRANFQPLYLNVLGSGSVEASSQRDNLIYRWKNSIVTNPNNKPSSFRLDQIERLEDGVAPDGQRVPMTMIHMACKTTSNYSGCPKYQKLWKHYQKMKHLVTHKAVVTRKDKLKLDEKEEELQKIRDKYQTKKYQAISVSSAGYYTTGIKTDIVQYAMILPILTTHLRLHESLCHLEGGSGYEFRDRDLLQKALTHPSYNGNYGTNPDHVRNTLSNCGLRNPLYGDKVSKGHHNRKRGIIMLNRIMNSKGDYGNVKKQTIIDPSHTSTSSNPNPVINHNERLEFLGDAVIEFLTSVHLFFMFPYIEEGGLAVYRAALVQNLHLTELAKTVELEKYMLYAHGPDLCHESDLNHAMSNAFEALLGAILLDGGIQATDTFLSKCLFGYDHKLHDVWTNLSRHPLQEDEPSGDRHWIPKAPVLSKLTVLEEQTGIRFNHIRLLARAFTLRNTGYNNLTLGHNQRLEFLGDTILQLITSEYLYKHFPNHHEGHLSLLRSCLVNNQTQAEVSNDLGLSRFIISSNEVNDLTTKDRADLLESFLGALYVDQGIEHCMVLFKVCFVNKLDEFIENQSWNDPKSLLQQCCLTLRNLDGKEPDVPIYKVIDCIGPSNNRKYKVGVYFRNNRLAIGWGRSKQQAEMEAAETAVKTYKSIFPQYTQRRS